ncbi:MAG TPA: chemotaxis response regulator protein-glutamate methylesterase [Spongiibacteraceae bacterium]|nr:chemotaxis response regulator protein-glutamate methylesterase [Spongiibacteraceae bacterium]
MAVTVLIVDDSGFFRRRLSEIINENPEFKVVGVASNGREGIEKAAELKPDVITMDYEMPVLDGISAVREIMAQRPTPILMFSSLTYEGARVTLDSLEAGAVDYLPKNFEEISRDSNLLKQKLWERLHEVARAGRRGALRQAPARDAVSARATPSRVEPTAGGEAAARPRRAPGKRYGAVLIGTSTGGPVALQTVLQSLPVNYPLPLVLIQHMPASFTRAFAERLNAICRIQVRQAEDGDVLQPGLALLAPGGKQLMLTQGGRVKVLPGDDRLNYKPCVDITFGSAANVLRDSALAVVLTGMGADGCEGARLLKRSGATVWAQDEVTSVIYGMPMAIARARLADEILPLHSIAARLQDIV